MDLAPDGYVNYTAPAGAVVVLDAKDGSVVALASNPTYPPSGWVGGISNQDFAAINNPASNYPLVNRGDARSVRARLDVQARDLARHDQRRDPEHRRLLHR